MIPVDKLFKFLPSSIELKRALTQIFISYYGKQLKINISKRTKNVLSTTHPSEIVSIIIDSGHEYSLFIKYEIASYSILNEHRKNLEYEDHFYKEVLVPLNLSTPRYFGSYLFSEGEIRMMVLEFIPNLLKVSKGPNPETMIKAAHWLANFHNETEKLLKGHFFKNIHTYDEDYFNYWANKIINHIRSKKQENEYRWLIELAEKFIQNSSLLCDSTPVIIHGEFYPGNVRYSNYEICVIDWQTVAISSYVIDLSALIEKWGTEISNLCINTYKSERKIIDSEQMLKKKIVLAQVYFNFIWLGNTQGTYNMEDKYVKMLIYYHQIFFEELNE